MFTEIMSLDFLWASYFGITKSEVKADNNYRDAAIACANRAYLDLCRRISFKYSSSHIEKMSINSRKEYISKKARFRSDAVSFIVDSILALEGDYDSFHKAICCGIIALSNGESVAHPEHREVFNEALNYGLAQKWLNMTIKNMLIMGLWNDLFDNYTSIIHIPLDSYIFSAAGGKEGEIIFRDERARHLGLKQEDFFDTYTWSKIPNEEKYIENYYQYQRMIREKTENRPVEWEHLAWIEQAKKEKMKSDKLIP